MIQMTATNIFIKTLSRFREQQTFAQIAKECRKQLKTNIFKAIGLKVGDIIHRFSYFEKKYYCPNAEVATAEWREDQKKVFLCFVLAFCRLYFRRVSEITEREWHQVSEAFGNKDVLFMKYQARVLERCSERVRWTREEELFLQNCIKSSMKGKWSQVSRQLFFESNGKYSKTPKQCRQHWFNHMDRQIKRGQWNIEQDLIILESVLDHGHKWARIVNLLVVKRTQHMIKNRYHSILTAFTKFTNEINKHKDQRKIVKIIMKELNSRKKVLGNYKKVPISQQQVQSNFQQQQILSNENIQNPFLEESIKYEYVPAEQRSVEFENYQKISETIKKSQNSYQSPNILYQVNPYNTNEYPILYGMASFNPLFIYPVVTNYNDVFYNI